MHLRKTDTAVKFEFIVRKYRPNLIYINGVLSKLHVDALTRFVNYIFSTLFIYFRWRSDSLHIHSTKWTETQELCYKIKENRNVKYSMSTSVSITTPNHIMINNSGAFSFIYYLSELLNVCFYIPHVFWVVW